MLLSMMLILAITSCLLELMIAAKIPAWRKLSAKSGLFNLLNSLAISFVMGIAFGAAGLVALGAGVISTILSVPGYQFLRWNYDTYTARAQGGNRTVYYWKNFHVHWAKWRKVLGEFNQLVYTIFRIITIPVRFLNAVFKFIRPYIHKYNAYVEAKRASTARP
jgi:hypothetical protein